MFSLMNDTTATCTSCREESLLSKAMTYYADTTSLDDHDITSVLLDPGLHAEVAIKDPKALSYVRNRLRCVLALSLGKGHIVQSVGTQVYGRLYPSPPDGSTETLVSPNKALASKLANACLRLLTGRDRLSELKTGDASAYTDAFVDVRAGEALKSAVEGVIGRSIGMSSEVQANTGRCAFSDGSGSQAPLDMASGVIASFVPAAAVSTSPSSVNLNAGPAGVPETSPPTAINDNSDCFNHCLTSQKLMQVSNSQLIHLVAWESQNMCPTASSNASYSDAWTGEDPCILATFESAIFTGLAEFLSPIPGGSGATNNIASNTTGSPDTTNHINSPMTSSFTHMEDLHRDKFKSAVEDDDAKYAALDHIVTVAQSYLIVTQRVWSAYEAHYHRCSGESPNESGESDADEEDGIMSGTSGLASSCTLSVSSGGDGDGDGGGFNIGSFSNNTAASTGTSVQLRNVTRQLEKERRAKRRSKPVPENALTRHMSWCCDIIDLILSSPLLVPPPMLAAVGQGSLAPPRQHNITLSQSDCITSQEDVDWNPRLTSCISRLLFVILSERRDIGEIMLRRMSSQAASLVTSRGLTSPLEHSGPLSTQSTARRRLGVSAVVTSHLLEHAVSLHALQPPAFNFSSNSWASRVQHLVSVGIEGMLGGQIADSQRTWLQHRRVRFMRELIHKRFGDGLSQPQVQPPTDKSESFTLAGASAANVVYVGEDAVGCNKAKQVNVPAEHAHMQVAARFPILNMLLWRTVLGGGNIGAVLEHCTSEEPYASEWEVEVGIRSNGATSAIPGADATIANDQLDIDSDYGSSIGNAPGRGSRTPTPEGSPPEGQLSPRADTTMDSGLSSLMPPNGISHVPRLSFGSSDHQQPPMPSGNLNTPSYADYKRTQPLAAFSAWGATSPPPPPDVGAIPLTTTLSIGIDDLSPLMDPISPIPDIEVPLITTTEGDAHELTCEDTAAFSGQLEDVWNSASADGSGLVPPLKSPLPAARTRTNAPFGANSARIPRPAPLDAATVGSKKGSVKRRSSSVVTMMLEGKTPGPPPPIPNGSVGEDPFIRGELMDLMQSSNMNAGASNSGTMGSGRFRSASTHSLNRSARRFSMGRIDEVDEHGFMLTPRDGGGIMITRSPSRSQAATPRDPTRSMSATPRDVTLDGHMVASLLQRRRSSTSAINLSPVAGDSPRAHITNVNGSNSLITSPRGGDNVEDAFSPVAMSSRSPRRGTNSDFFMPFGVAQASSFDAPPCGEGGVEIEGFTFQTCPTHNHNDDGLDDDDDDMLGRNFRTPGQLDEEDELDRALSGGDLEAARAEAMEGETERKVQLSLTGRAAVVEVVLGNLPHLLECFLAVGSVSALTRTNQRCAIIGLLQVTTKCCMDTAHLHDYNSDEHLAALKILTSIITKFCEAMRQLVVVEECTTGIVCAVEEEITTSMIAITTAKKQPISPPPPANSIVLNKATSFLLGCFVGAGGLEMSQYRQTIRATIACLLARQTPTITSIPSVRSPGGAAARAADFGLPPLGAGVGVECNDLLPITTSHSSKDTSPSNTRGRAKTSGARCPTPPNTASLGSSTGRIQHQQQANTKCRSQELDDSGSLAGSIGRGGSSIAAKVALESARRALPTSSDDDLPHNSRGGTSPPRPYPLPPLVPTSLLSQCSTDDHYPNEAGPPVYRCDVAGFTTMYNRMLDELKAEEYHLASHATPNQRATGSSYLGALKGGGSSVESSSMGMLDVRTDSRSASWAATPVYAQRYRIVDEEDMWLLQGMQGNKGAHQRVSVAGFDTMFRSGPNDDESLVPSTFLAQSWLLFDPNETPEGHLHAQDYHKTVGSPPSRVRVLDTEDGASNPGGIRRRGGASNSPSSSSTVVGAWGTRLATAGTWGDSSGDDEEDDEVLVTLKEPPPLIGGILNLSTPPPPPTDEPLYTPTPRPGPRGSVPVGKLFNAPILSPVPPPHTSTNNSSASGRSRGRPNSSSSRLESSMCVEGSSDAPPAILGSLGSMTEFSPRPNSATSIRFPPTGDPPSSPH